MGVFSYRFKTLGLGKAHRQTPWVAWIGIRQSLHWRMGGSSLNRNSRFTQKTANNGSARASGSRSTFVVDNDPGKIQKAKTSAWIERFQEMAGRA